ncbi:MAG: AMP-binding protein [Firmicutes bacterium]|nr:AMP-binding protein [Bacillota bacterium]
MKDIKQLTQVYENDTYSDFRDLLNKAAEKYRDSDAFIVKDMQGRKEISYEHISFNRFRDDVNALGEGLLGEFGTGKRFAIIGKNRYEWLLGYFAVLGGLGMCVPLDKGLPYEELESSLARSYADVLIYDPTHQEQVDRLKGAGKTNVSAYICMEKGSSALCIEEIIAAGRGAEEKRYPDLYVNPEKIDILLFTSGTTSMAKAVMLSQRNIMSNLEAIEKVIDIRPTDVSMAFLPYHHTFGATGQFAMIAGGAASTYCDGLKYLQKNLVEYKVSVFFCVPLLIESVYKKVMATVKKEGKEKTVAFGMKLTKLLMKFGIDIRRKIFGEILDKLGGNIRLVISGASAIDPEALAGFKSFGIEAIQGYGMTESSPVICAENIYENKLGSIGRPLPGIDVKIFEPNDEGVGELIARGPNVMAGYYGNEEETAKTLVDGWLHTGDLAYVDKDGYIFICGRKKNVIVLKNGKNVYPEELEVLISNLPYVEECMVFGQPRNHDGDHKDLAICAKIVYKPEWMKENHGQKGGVSGSGGETGLDVATIEAYVKADIDKINETLPTYKQMLRVVVTDQEMIKTTTGKVKRYEEEKKM